MNEVALLIPHFNNPSGLKKSLLSIGYQENIDIVVVDDGSSINKFNEEEIRSSFQANGKVFFLYLSTNQGIEVALNKGLQFIKDKEYKLVARLDCDDLCIKNRFYKQVEFLKNNPDVFLIGSFVEAISPEGKFLYYIKAPTSHQEIKQKMFFNSMFIHSTVMFRIEILESVGFYPIDYKAAEDYAFFFSIISRHKTAILPEVLVRWQVDDHGISATKRSLQLQNRLKLIRKNFYFGYYPIAGLLRNYVITLIPRDTLKKLKVLLYNK